MRVVPLLTLATLCLTATTAGAYQWPTPTAENSIGVNVWYTTGPDELQALVDAHVHLVRIPFRWSEICVPIGDGCQCQWDEIGRIGEPYDIDSIDIGAISSDDHIAWIVKWCLNNNIRVVASLDGIEDASHVNCTASRDPNSLEFQVGFGKFVDQALARFHGHNIIWELWNEPNMSTLGVDGYMALANWEVAPRVQAWDPGAPLVGPALSDAADPAKYGNPIGYLEALLNYKNFYAHLDPPIIVDGFFDTFDGVTVHPYRGTNPESVIDHYGEIHSLINKYSGTIPVLSGEWGYPDTSLVPSNIDYCGAKIPRQTQADYVARMFLTNLNEGIPLSIVYQIIDGPASADGCQNAPPWPCLENHFGLLGLTDGNNQPYTPKPAYYALKTLQTTLGNSTVLYGDVSPNHPDYDYVIFTASNGKLTLAIWDTEPTTRVFTSDYWGKFLLNNTPLYVGEEWIWQCHGNTCDGNWSDNRWVADYAWTNDGWQARIDSPASINVDGERLISGLQLNAGGITLNGLPGGKLRFTPGGGNIYAALDPDPSHGSFSVIATEIGDAAERGGDAKMFTNTPETFVLRKSGDGEVGLNANNTFHGTVLVGQGYLDLGSDQALGAPDALNPVVLAGGGIDFNGYSPTTGPLSITANSDLGNYRSNTYSQYNFGGATISSDFSVSGAGNLYLGGQMNLVNGARTITKNHTGALNIGGAGVNMQDKLTFNTVQGDVIVTAPITGTGDVFKEGTATLNFVGSNSFNGRTVVDGGTLRVFGNNFSGATIINAGGTLVLEGTGAINTAAGITISGGALYQNSASPLAVGISVQNGGTFGGIGKRQGSLTFGSSRSALAGHLSPGGAPNLIGTLLVEGSLGFYATGHLDIDIGAGYNDKVQMSGTYSSLTLGGTLNVAEIGPS